MELISRTGKRQSRPKLERISRHREKPGRMSMEVLGRAD
jgi:hypothetical protein